MATALVVFGGIWMALSLIFCLALCVAAARPRPEFEAEEQSLEPQSATKNAADEGALCVR